MRAIILDGYVDEPSCLGVPPYIAPYPRYVAGMLRKLGYKYVYITIDALRKNRRLKDDIRKSDVLIIIAGIAVPGKYLGGNPLSKKEVLSLGLAKHNFLVGPMVLEMDNRDVEMLRDVSIEPIRFPFERELFERLMDIAGIRVEFDLNDFAVAGADVIREHHDYPNVICEIETYRGCYWGKCSFCIERIHGMWIRRAGDVVREIGALYLNGCRHFRLGRQTDFFTYLADFSFEIPKPDPEKLKKFHQAVWRACPRIKTLHLDNVNPKTIAEYPEEAKEIVKIITIYQTPGNVAAMGLESADENVIRKNTLCSSPEEVMRAIEIVNEYGRFIGHNGLPLFLPGINFVAGLKGERAETYEINIEFLREVMRRGYLLRRINIRQVKIFRGTPMEKEGYRKLKKHKRYFNTFKKRVREEIDRPMIKKILPKGRKVTDVRCEVCEDGLCYGRQIATYPVLIGIIGGCDVSSFTDVRIIAWGYRSVTAVKYPLNVNTASYEELEAIAGRRANELVVRRPFKSMDEVKEVFENAELYFTV